MGSSASNNLIGSNLASEGNTLAFNGVGASLQNGGTGNRILGNRVFSNTGQQITLSGGSNNNIAAPVITNAVRLGNNTNLTGTYNGANNATYDLQFFASNQCSTGNGGQGQLLLGTQSVTTDAGGAASFNVALPGNLSPGQFVAATATRTADGTSAFSPCFGVTLPFITGRIVDAANNGVPGVNVTLSGAVSSVAQTDASGNYAFRELQPLAPYTVKPVSPTFTISPPRVDIPNLDGNRTGVNFTAAPVPPPGLPPLSDNFNAPNRDPELFSLGLLSQPQGSFDPAVTTSQATGQLVITPRANAPGAHYNGYVGVNNYDFTNGLAAVELALAGMGGAESLFSLGADINNYSRFLVATPLPGQLLRFEEIREDGTRHPVESTMPMLMFQIVANGQVILNISLPYDPVAHRFLRFRHLARDANNNPANLLVFETSPDATAWTERARGDLGERSVAAITVELGGGTGGASGGPGPIIFDNLITQVVNARFMVASATVAENAGVINVTVTRAGLTNIISSVEYFTADGTAQQRSRYLAAAGVLNFAAGETMKTFPVLIVDDALVQGAQTFDVFLNNGVGMGVNGPARSVITITDNDAPPITANPIDTAQFYVRQQYYDFLAREPDAAGFDYWVGQVTQCGADANCVNRQRIGVSAAFFVELEFQVTGYAVHRLYRTAYGNRAAPDNTRVNMAYSQFLLDRAQLVAGPDLPATTLALAGRFAQRPQFRSAYPSAFSPAQYVNKLFDTAGLTGAQFDAARQTEITAMQTQGRSRAQVLLNVANNSVLQQREYNPSFVLMQYFGYLRRDPDQGGYDFWLGILNQQPANLRGMVCAFITAEEYQTRFSPVVTRTNQLCSGNP